LYLEGRATTALLVCAMNSRMMIPSVVVRSLEQALILADVNQFSVLALVEVRFYNPLFIILAFEFLPKPNERKINERTKRVSMNGLN
jgi:hypothetical protein